MSTLPHSSNDDHIVRVDDTDTYRLTAAARELEALVLYEEARRLAEVRELLAELYERDEIQVEEADLDAQAEEVALQERADRFLHEQAARLDRDPELLGLARQLDDHALEMWRAAAASLAEVCPPSLRHLRSRVTEEQRAQLRSQAQEARREATLKAQLAGLGLARRLVHRREVADLCSELAACRGRSERSQVRLSWLAAKLQVIDTAEQVRGAWLADAHDVLVRGVAAARMLAERAEQAATIESEAVPARPASEGGRLGPQVAS